MKISASIYSNKTDSLQDVIQDLERNHVELLHVDCNDDLSVFDDIKTIRTLTNLPIDLHIITEHPSKYFELLRENPVEYITFQFEDSKEDLLIPSDITGQIGLGIITPTSIDVFEEFKDNFDFILVMATIPGQSGGVFDKVNFKKIRDFQKKYPSKNVHVDGGVNGEISFILRNMGVYSSVSGSYLFKADSVSQALMNLKLREIESHFKIGDFMLGIDETPVVLESDLTFANVLKTIEKGKLGFCIVTDASNNFKGLISNADVRKGLIKHLSNLNEIPVKELINSTPVFAKEEHTVVELLQLIKAQSFPVMYLPILNGKHEAVGIITFVNLIKGEL
jgi:pentose-5-phosphate-3-epimerase